MSYRIYILLCFAGLLYSSYSTADTMVQKLQQPAWLERNKVRSSLYPGQSLTAGDRIVTGSRGKVLLQMPEGSMVKLGVNADFSVRSLSEEVQAGESIFSGAWQVIKGAFRFTTAQVKKRYRRDVKVQIGTATIGIRGTDVWGKADEDKDFIVLLEGSITVERENDAMTTMDTPLTIYDAPRNLPANAVVAVDPEKLQAWALETELDAGQGVIAKEGPYVVYLLSTLSMENAERRTAGLKSQGFAASITAHQIDQKTWYRIGVNGFVTYQDAQAFVVEAENHFKLTGVWISNRE